MTRNEMGGDGRSWSLKSIYFRVMVKRLAMVICRLRNDGDEL